MATVAVNGITLEYEEMGSGAPIVFTAGGRWGREYHRPIAELMAPHYRAIIYDRRNCGRSDIDISGEGSEAEIWAEDLAELIRQLGIAPAYVCEYGGCRLGPLLAIRHPEVVKALLLGWPCGGKYPAQRLSQGIYGVLADAAEQGGMAAVLEKPFIRAEGAEENPVSRERLLAMDVQEFIRVIRGWQAHLANSADLPMAGSPATEEQVASIRVPTVIIAGDDEIHTLTCAQMLHRLIPNSEYHDPPLSGEEFTRMQGGFPNAREVQAESAAPIFLDFLRRLESK